MALPNALLEANSANPTGYWEPKAALELNDAFLTRTGSSWFDPTLRLQSDAAHVDADVARAYVASLRAFLTAHEQSRPLVIKEPRIASVWPYWLDAVTAEDYRINIIVPVRHPVEVAKSLAARDGISVDLAYTMWLKNNLLAERDSRPHARSFVSYTNLMHDWRREIERISYALDLDLTARDFKEIDAFLDPQLYHQDRSLDERSHEFVPWVSRVYAQLSGAARDEPLDFGEMERAFRDYERSARAAQINGVFDSSTYMAPEWETAATKIVAGLRRSSGYERAPATPAEDVVVRDLRSESTSNDERIERLRRAQAESMATLERMHERIAGIEGDRDEARSRAERAESERVRLETLVAFLETERERGASAESDARAESERGLESLRARIDEAERARDAALGDAESAAAERSELAARIELAAAALAELQARAEFVVVERDAMEARALAAEVERDENRARFEVAQAERDAVAGEIERLRGDLEHVRRELDASRGETSGVRESLRAAESEREEFRAQTAALESEREKQSVRLSELKRGSFEMQGRLEETSSLLRKSEAARNAANGEGSRYRSIALDLEGDVSGLLAALRRSEDAVKLVGDSHRGAARSIAVLDMSRHRLERALASQAAAAEAKIARSSLSARRLREELAVLVDALATRERRIASLETALREVAAESVRAIVAESERYHLMYVRMRASKFWRLRSGVRKLLGRPRD